MAGPVAFCLAAREERIVAVRAASSFVRCCCLAREELYRYVTLQSGALVQAMLRLCVV